ncbi:hypothetical protein KQH24_32500, partial [Streptomyces sp. CHB9.2]|nr:hypothetical protein [Streptomyces sp. CHB9.2]
CPGGADGGDDTPDRLQVRMQKVFKTAIYKGSGPVSKPRFQRSSSGRYSAKLERYVKEDVP